MKIRIFGCCGSGKSYIAERLSEKYNIRHFDMDELYWNFSCYPYKEKPKNEIENLIEIIMKENSWCIEGAYANWGMNSFLKADYVFIIKKSKWLCRFGVIKRYIKKKLHFQKGYKETLNDVKDMFVLIKNFDKKINIIQKFLLENKKNFYFIKNYKDIFEILRYV